MTAPPQDRYRRRRSGRAAGILLFLTGLLIGLAAASFLWLHYSGQWIALTSATPRVEIELAPAPGSITILPAETPAAPIPPEEPVPAEEPAPAEESAAPATPDVTPAAPEELPAEPAELLDGEDEAAVPAPPEPEIAEAQAAAALPEAEPETPATVAASDEPTESAAASDSASTDGAASDAATSDSASTDSVPSDQGQTPPSTDDETPAAESAMPAVLLPAAKPAEIAELPPEEAPAEAAAPAAVGEPQPFDPNATATDAGEAVDPPLPVSTQDQVASAVTPLPSGTGVTPFELNARPFLASDPRPRVAIIVGGLGISDIATRNALDQLPPEVTLAFNPYSKKLDAWIAEARAKGHEVLIELPMESINYPAEEPGPQGLLSGLTLEENRARLDWVLSRSDQAAGVVALLGGRFLGSARLIRPVLTELSQRGYLFVDNGTGPYSVIPTVAPETGTIYAQSTRYIDGDATRVSIDGRLQQLEQRARDHGRALGIAFAYPVSIERIVAWARTLGVKGIALAPASAVAQR